MTINRSTVLALAVATVMAGGCQRSAPPAPPAPPPPPAVTASPPLPPGHPPLDMRQQALPDGAVAQAANPHWTVPASWQPGMPSSVRRASFTVTNASGQSVDIAVTAFPGDVGGSLANLNRWRSQIGLAPATEAEAAAATTSVDLNGVTATVVDLTGATQRMIVVTLLHAGNSWFFKLVGDPAVAETQKPVLMEFVNSVRF